jgi:hypothetical protein
VEIAQAEEQLLVLVRTLASDELRLGDEVVQALAVGFQTLYGKQRG